MIEKKDKTTKITAKQLKLKLHLQLFFTSWRDSMEERKIKTEINIREETTIKKTRRKKTFFFLITENNECNLSSTIQ